MKDNKNNLVVFDLDGTLSQSNLFSLPAIQDTQKVLGFPPTDHDTLIAIYGAPFEEFFDLIFPGAGEDIIPKYYEQVAISEQKYKHLAKPFDGVVEMLEEIKNNGYNTAVCSNADINYIMFVLDALMITSKIDYVQELKEEMTSKTQSLGELLSKVEYEKAIMVGDTLYDYLAAKDNNIDFIGCTYGFKPLDMEKMENKVKSALELPNVIDRLCY